MEIKRGDVWLCDLNPTKGREQHGIRPVLIFSNDAFNNGTSQLVVILPITSKFKGIPLHVEIRPPEANLNETSYIKCEDIRSISRDRLLKKIGRVEDETIEEIEDKILILLNIFK